MKSSLDLKIGGMSCGHCVSAVKKSLERLSGVSVENVDVGSARLSYDSELIDRERIVEAVREAGYQPASVG